MNSFLLLPLFLFLFGCTHLGTMDSTAERLRQLDLYMANHEFDQALALIDDTPRLDVNEVALDKERKIVLEQRHLFEKQVIAMALKQEQKNDWPGAKKTYHRALETAGTSPDLKQAQQDMLLRFQGRMETLKTEELIVNGEWLHRKLPLLKKQHVNDPQNLTIKWRYLKTKEEAKTTGMELLQLGERMLAERDLEMARRTIPLAVELSPGVETEDANARLNKILKARKKKVQQSREEISRVKDKKEIEAFNDAMAHGRLSLAREHLLNLSPAAGKSMEAELMRERLNRAVDAYVQERKSIGAAYYRVGEYELAIRVWHNILELEPDNEAVKNKMERAERIVENLKILRDRQEQE